MSRSRAKATPDHDDLQRRHDATSTPIVGYIGAPQFGQQPIGRGHIDAPTADATALCKPASSAT